MRILAKQLANSTGEALASLVNGLKSGAFTGITKIEKLSADDQKKVKALFGKDWNDKWTKTVVRSNGELDALTAKDAELKKAFEAWKVATKAVNTKLESLCGKDKGPRLQPYIRGQESRNK